jgi:hypothetical protein
MLRGWNPGKARTLRKSLLEVQCQFLIFDRKYNGWEPVCAVFEFDVDVFEDAVVGELGLKGRAVAVCDFDVPEFGRKHKGKVSVRFETDVEGGSLPRAAFRKEVPKADR